MALSLGLVIGALFFAPAGHAAPGGDVWGKLQETATTAGKAIAGAFMIIGAVIAGGSIILGSREAGHHAKNFFIGAFFLGLVAFGTGLYSMVSGWLGTGQ